MIKAVAINGSPHKHKGNTAMLLTPLVEGMQEAGAEVDTYYAKDLQVESCRCIRMYCWYKKPGICCLEDDMDSLYPKLREAEILILATPVYIPLPGEIQNIINRLCPLLIPRLEIRDGRTRAHFRDDVKIKKILLVSTGGWWEKGNFGTVIRIAEELAEDASVEFAGAVIRPHAHAMHQDGQLTKDGAAICAAAKKAGKELIINNTISPQTFEEISKPLMPEEMLLNMYNDMIKQS